jgi:hypothetical protein
MLTRAHTVLPGSVTRSVPENPQFATPAVFRCSEQVLSKMLSMPALSLMFSTGWELPPKDDTTLNPELSAKSLPFTLP